MAPVWLAPAARRAAATTARRAPPLLLDSTASSTARRATLQPAQHISDAAATNLLTAKAKQPLALLDPAATHLLAGKAKQPLALLDDAATHLLDGKAKQPLALFDAAATNLLSRAPLLAGKAKQTLALLDATATDTHLLGRAPLLAATAKQPPALLDAPASSSAVKAIADVRQAPIAKLAHGPSPKTGGVFFDLYGPRRASRGILFSAMNSGHVRTLARRGISTDASFSPELTAELQRVEKASVARHKELMGQIKGLEDVVLTNYSAAKLASAEKDLTSGRVAMQVSSLVLLFGVATLVAVLQAVKSGWAVDFVKSTKSQLEELVASIKAEVLAQLRKIIREEILVSEAKKATRK